MYACVRYKASLGFALLHKLFPIPSHFYISVFYTDNQMQIITTILIKRPYKDSIIYSNVFLDVNQEGNCSSIGISYALEDLCRCFSHKLYLFTKTASESNCALVNAPV